MNDRVKKYKEKILEGKEKFIKRNKNFISSSSCEIAVDTINDKSKTKDASENFKDQVRKKKQQDEKIRSERIEKNCKAERVKIVKENKILEFSKDDIVKGIVLSEILGKPKSLKRR